MKVWKERAEEKVTHFRYKKIISQKLGHHRGESLIDFSSESSRARRMLVNFFSVRDDRRDVSVRSVRPRNNVFELLHD